MQSILTVITASFAKKKQKKKKTNITNTDEALKTVASIITEFRNPG